MAVLAIYSPKGGVGKTTLAVNLAWASAALAGHRTLLWDLDAQAGSTFILGADRGPSAGARGVIARDTSPEELVVATGTPLLDLLPADASLRALDLVLAELGANKRLRRIAEALSTRYDHVVIDCPPGLGVTAEQIIRSATLIVMPLIPSPLAMRAADELRLHLERRRKPGPPVLPVFNLVDRRRALHRNLLATMPEQPAIPMATSLEKMAERRAPVGAYARRSAAAQAVSDLWEEVEQRLGRRPRTPIIRIPVRKSVPPAG